MRAPANVRLMTLKEAAKESGLPLASLRRAVYAKWRRLEAVQIEVVPDLILWHTWPEALEEYKKVHREAPWKRKQPK